MAFTFKGGIHVHEHKIAKKAVVERLPAPPVVTIPLSQHIGAHCKPLVKAGDLVDRGQLIADNESGLCAPIHASVSGKVAAVEQRFTHNGIKTEFIIIDNDFQNRVHPDIKPFPKAITETTPEEIIKMVRSAGIVGLGGATFPTYAKISSAAGKVQTLIINCAECEPYITANHRLMVESPELIVNGLKILLCAFKLKVGYIAIEDNKLNAADKISEIVGKNDMVGIKILKTKYPQGDERQLIFALTGKELPAGKLPADVGCVVFNAETCAAVCNSFITGMPLVERIVTVSGDCIENHKNLIVPLGTPTINLLDFCGLKKEPKKLINGGPMMGTAIWNVDAPITKGTSAILALEKNAFSQGNTCIHCGRCVDGCPMRLIPAYLGLFSRNDDMEACEKYDALSCVECGCCTYICPAGIPIVQYIRTAKGRIQEKRQREALLAQAKKTEAPEPNTSLNTGRAAAAGRVIESENRAVVSGNEIKADNKISDPKVVSKNKKTDAENNTSASNPEKPINISEPILNNTPETVKTEEKPAETEIINESLAKTDDNKASVGE